MTFTKCDPIPEAKSNDEWKQADKSKKPVWCYYENISTNGKKFGKLYNWYAVNDSRGLAPDEWHIPSRSEWEELQDLLGGARVVGSKMKSALCLKEDK